MPSLEQNQTPVPATQSAETNNLSSKNNANNQTKNDKTAKKEYKNSYKPKYSSVNKTPLIIASLALIAAFGSLSLSAILWQQKGKSSVKTNIVATPPQIPTEFKQQISNLETQMQQLRSQIQQQNTQIEDVATKLAQEDLSSQRRLLAQLQGDTQSLDARLERTLGANRDDWRLVEAESLLRLAIIRTQTMQDARSALLLLQTADEILQKQDDSSSFAAREQLAVGIEQLQMAAKFDRTGLYLQLSSLRSSVAKLDKEQAKFVPNLPKESTKAYANWWDEISQNATNWRHWLGKIDNYVRLDFKANPNTSSLIASHNAAQSRLALMLALEQASWAVLNANQEIYNAALQQGQNIMQQGFDLQNPNAKALSERLQELQLAAVAFNAPDLNPALKAVQNYINKRNSLRHEHQAEKTTDLNEQDQNMAAQDEPQITTDEPLSSNMEATDETL